MLLYFAGESNYIKKKTKGGEKRKVIMNRVLISPSERVSSLEAHDHKCVMIQLRSEC